MEQFSALLARCGDITGPGEFPAQRPVTRSFDVFFDLRLNKRLSKQPSGWWFERPPWSLWRNCNDGMIWSYFHPRIVISEQHSYIVIQLFFAVHRVYDFYDTKDTIISHSVCICVSTRKNTTSNHKTGNSASEIHLALCVICGLSDDWLTCEILDKLIWHAIRFMALYWDMCVVSFTHIDKMITHCREYTSASKSAANQIIIDIFYNVWRNFTFCEMWELEMYT